MRFRTKSLLALLFICGISIGVLSPFADGLYSAVSLFFLPFLVAFSALAIGIDLNRPPQATVETTSRARPAQRGVVLRMPLVANQKLN